MPALKVIPVDLYGHPFLEASMADSPPLVRAPDRVVAFEADLADPLEAAETVSRLTAWLFERRDVIAVTPYPLFATEAIAMRAEVITERAIFVVQATRGIHPLAPAEARDHEAMRVCQAVAQGCVYPEA